MLLWALISQQIIYSALHVYDPLNRLSQVVNNDGTVTEYTYDAAGNRLSKTTTLAPPTITTNPQDRTTVAGQSTAFSVGATGSAPLAYSWKFNGTDLTGETNFGLYLSNVSHTEAGNYTVVVSNNAGSVTSDLAALEVLIPFNYWTTIHFTSEEQADSSISGPDATPLKDGVSNVFKYLHNIDPMLPLTAEDRASSLPRLGLERVGDFDYLTLTYRDNPLATEITVEVQTSSDLAADPWGTVTPDVTEILPEPDPTTGDPIRRVKVNVSGEDRAFIRLKVSVASP